MKSMNNPFSNTEYDCFSVHDLIFDDFHNEKSQSKGVNWKHACFSC